MSKQEESTKNKFSLFSVAVILMAAVSCYTTALGVEPMIGNEILSWVVAIALSLFMVSIALKFPQAYEEGRHRQMIWGYSAVALFSVLLNFNAIYGKFTAEKLLYEELSEKRKQIENLANQGVILLGNEVGLTEAQKEFETAKVAYDNELKHPNRPGHGKRAERLYQLKSQAEAKVNAAKSQIEDEVTQIERIKLLAFTDVDSTLPTKDIIRFQSTVDPVINRYNEIGNLLKAKLGEDKYSYEEISFIHRDAGNLNHSLWTITQVFSMGGKQATAVIVSLLLSILIDFIVLFVLILTNIGGGGSGYHRPRRSGKPGPIFRKNTNKPSGSIIVERE